MRIQEASRRGMPKIVMEMATFIREEDEAQMQEDWWRIKTAVVVDWLDANPLKIGIPDDGTEETIRSQIQRGEKHTSARVKCWNHIVSEIHELPGVCKRIATKQTVRSEELAPEEAGGNDQNDDLPIADQEVDDADDDDDNDDDEDGAEDGDASEQDPNDAGEEEREANNRNDEANQQQHPVAAALERHRSPMRGRMHPSKRNSDSRGSIVCSKDELTAAAAAVVSHPSNNKESQRSESDASKVSDQLQVVAESKLVATPAASVRPSSGKNLSQMSMLERQQEWLRRKSEKAAAEKQRQEHEVEKELTFQPKIIRRGESFNAVASRLASTGTVGGSGASKASASSTNGNSASVPSTSADSASNTNKSSNRPPPLVRAGSAKTYRRHTMMSAALESLTPHKKASSSGQEMGQLDKKKKIKRRLSKRQAEDAAYDEVSVDLDDKDGQEPIMEAKTQKAPLVASRSVGTMAKSVHLPAISNNGNSAASSVGDGAISQLSHRSSDQQQESSKPATPSAQQQLQPQQSSSQHSARAVAAAAAAMTFQADLSGVDPGRLRFQLQDSTPFDLKTIYRRKDKHARHDGITLQVGRREDTHEEEVLAIYFDKEKISQEEAATWWQEHHHRFASKKLSCT